MKQPKTSALLIIFLLAFLAGVGVGEFVSVPIWVLVVGLPAVALAKAGVGLPAIAPRSGAKTGCWLAGLLVVGVALGMLRVELGRHITNVGTVDFYNDSGEAYALVGVITEEPDRRADHTKYTLEISELDGQKVTGRVLVKAGKLPEYFYGDELKITGKLQAPFETEEFSYRDYLARYGVYSTMYSPRVQKISSGKRNLFFTQLFAFKRFFENTINRVFPEPQASFMAGLLVGSRKGIPPDVTADFNATGLTHIIAISGYNIAIVIAFITGLFGSIVPRRWQFPLAAFFVSVFTLLVGASPAVVRAAIMGLLAFYALTHGRQYQVTLGLVFSAALMVFVNPQILLHDVSFQLSFAAVAGLMFVSPILEKWFAKIPNKFAIRESLLMTMSAQVTAVPLIVFYFARLSLVAPLANVLVAPAIPLAMLTGFIAVVAGIVFLPLGILFGFVAHALLTYILWVAKLGAQLPGANLEIGWFGITFAVIYYMALVGYLVWRVKAIERARA